MSDPVTVSVVVYATTSPIVAEAVTLGSVASPITTVTVTLGAALSPAQIASGIAAATEKTTPALADKLALVDSAAAGALKWISLTNFKTWIQTFAGAVSVAWDAVTGKPSTFPPSPHGHVSAQITDATAGGEGNADAGKLLKVSAYGQILSNGVTAMPSGAETRWASLTPGVLTLRNETGLDGTFEPSNLTAPRGFQMPDKGGTLAVVASPIGAIAASDMLNTTCKQAASELEVVSATYAVDSALSATPLAAHTCYRVKYGIPLSTVATVGAKLKFTFPALASGAISCGFRITGQDTTVGTVETGAAATLVEIYNSAAGVAIFTLQGEFYLHIGANPGALNTYLAVAAEDGNESSCARGQGAFVLVEAIGAVPWATDNGTIY